MFLLNLSPIAVSATRSLNFIIYYLKSYVLGKIFFFVNFVSAFI
jgi:hypothetical protein